jgi:NADH-quinone oxidoreductase subunit E
MTRDEATTLIERHQREGSGLVALLEDIQGKYGYLPEAALREVAQRTGRSLVDVYGVATFYRAFSLKPRGKHQVTVCLGTACHVRGGPRILQEFQRQLGVPAGETTLDREFTLEAVACLGACALGPIVVADGHYFSKVEPTKVKTILAKARKGLDTVEIAGDERIFPVELSCPRCNHSLMDPEQLVDGLPAIRVSISFNQQHGWLLLSSLYGSYAVASEHAIPEQSVAEFFCPHCHGELIGGTPCPECETQMVPMIVRGGGVVQICPRRGCKGHMLDLSGVNV